LVLEVKWVSEIIAKSILFSFRVVINSFLWFARPLVFHNRMTRDCEVNELFGILGKYAVKDGG